MYLYIKTGLTVFIVLYTTRLILQSLGETDFGVFNIVGGVISMLGFLNTSMAVTIQRFLNYEQGKGNDSNQNAIFNVGVVFHAVIALIIPLILLLFGHFLFGGILNIPVERIPAAKIVYICLIISTAFTILTVPYDACLNAHENMLYYSIVGIIEALLKLVVAFIVVNSNKDKLVLYGVLMAIIPILSMSMMRFYCHANYSECRLAPKDAFNKDIAKRMLSFAGWNLLGSSSNYLGNYGNMIVMNHYYGAIMNTVMGIANQIQGQLMVLSSGMLKALNPVIAKEEGAGNSNRMLLYSLAGCKYSFYLFSIFALPMIVYTPFILKLWLGSFPEWTILFVRLQLVRALLELLTVSMTKSLEAKGKIRFYNASLFFFNILPVPILAVLYSRGAAPYWHYIVSISLMVIIPSLIKIVLCKYYCKMKVITFLLLVIIPTLIPSIIALCVCFLSQLMVDNTIVSFCLAFLSSLFVISLSGFLSLSKNQKSAVLAVLSKHFRQ